MLAAFGHLLVVCAAFVACSIGPGLIFVRRTALSGAEKVAAAFGLSVLLMAGATLLIYIPGSTQTGTTKLPPTSYGALAVFGIASFGYVWEDLKALWRDPEARAIIRVYALVAAWMFGLLGIIRSFGGGGWAGDWIEQYERARFFLKHQPLYTEFQHTLLPARPPLLNLFCVPFFELAGAGMPQFQALCALLSVSAVFPVYLVARRLSGTHAVPTALAVAVVAFNPMMVQNTTYPWTKMLTAAYVAMGLYFYTTGWKSAEPLRVRLAVCMLGAGLLTHYSAAPYAIAVALHFLVYGCKPFARSDRELAITGLLAVAVVAPWLGWSMSTYGSAITFASNTTAEGFSQHSAAHNLRMALGNVYRTIVPHFFRGIPIVWAEPGGWGHFREVAFLAYQANLLLMFGTTGWILLTWYLVRHWMSTSADRDLGVFWLIMVGVGLVGVAAHPWRDYYGLAHLSMQPLMLVGLGVLAGTSHEWPEMLRRIFLGGLVADLLFGVALHVIYETRTFGPGPAGEAGLIPGGERAVADPANLNWTDKGQHHFMFIGDALQPLKWIVAFALIVAAAVIIRQLGALLGTPGLSSGAARVGPATPPPEGQVEASPGR
jgi:hypothetical protein